MSYHGTGGGRGAAGDNATGTPSKVGARTDSVQTIQDLLLKVKGPSKAAQIGQSTSNNQSDQMSPTEKKALIEKKVQSLLFPQEAQEQAAAASAQKEIEELGFFQPYEDDGDSIMGALLPNVFIKKITIEDKNYVGEIIDREPHIIVEEFGGLDVLQPLSANAAGAFNNEAKYAQVTVDLLFKEKVETDDISLFTIDSIINALKLKVVFCTNASKTFDVMKSNSNISFDAGLYIPQEVGKKLADPDFTIGPYQNGNGLIKEYSLKEISQFNGIFNSGMQDPTSLSNKFLANLNKQTLSDGTKIYNIPYKVTVPLVYFEKNLQHLTIFASTFIDFESILNKQDEYSFALSKEEQFKSMGYDPSEFKSNHSFLITAFNDFKALIKDYGYGLPAINTAISNGKVNHNNKKYVYRGIEPPYKNKAGLVWYGPVHYHGPNNPAPDGYQGFMGGTPEHMDQLFKPTPKLKEITANGIGEILDLRRQKQLEQIFFNYSDFGMDTTFKEFVSKPPITLEMPDAGSSLHEKQTKSNDWLKAKQSSVFSNPDYSINSDGEISFCFGFDYFKALRYHTAFPGLADMLSSGQIQGTTSADVSIIYGAKVVKLSIFRKEVSNLKNANGDNLQIKKDTPTFTIATLYPQAISEANEKLNEATSAFGFTFDLESLNSIKTKQSLGQIEVLDLMTELFPVDSIAPQSAFATNVNGVLHYSFKDYTTKSEKNSFKSFQYGVEIELEDPIFNFINQKLSIVKETGIELKKYFNFCNSNSDFTNSYTNSFTSEFYEIWEDSDFNTDPSGPESFDKSDIFKQVKRFLDEVIYVLKPMATSEKLDLLGLFFSYMSPVFGSPSGIEAVYNFVSLVQKSLQNLIDTTASQHSSIKSSTMGENTLEAKITAGKATKDAKNIIKIRQIFKDAVTINDHKLENNVGYEYIFENEFGIPSTNFKTMPKITTLNMIGRVSLESEKYEIPDNFSFLSVSPDPAEASFLGPLTVKTDKGTRILDKTNYFVVDDKNKNNIDAVIDILETKQENTVHLDLQDVNETTLVIETAPLTLLGDIAVQSSKKEVPNMAGIFSNQGVSFENISEKIQVNDQVPLVDLETSLEKTNKYKKNIESVFGPASTPDVSQLMFTMLLITKTNYVNGNSLGVDAISKELLYYHDQLISDPSKLKPNQILKLINQYATAISSDTGTDQTQAKELYKKTFDNYINLANLIINYSTLVQVEYLAGFKNGNVKDKIFKVLNQASFNEIVSEINEGNNKNKCVLIRLRPYEDTVAFKLNDNFKMPIFNQSFLLTAKE